MAAGKSSSGKPKKTSLIEKQKNSQAKGAQRAMLEELFNDFYIQRGKVYKMNFVRGILFGLGSALGGTIGLAIILTLLVWLLNVLGGFPVVGDWFQGLGEDISRQ